MTDVTLSPSQEVACNAFQDFLSNPNQKEFLLSGYAGSGKTFLVEYLVELARDEHELARLIKPTTPGMTFHFTATTNKAAKVLADAIGEPAKTIHQALGLTVRQDYKTGRQYLQKNKDKGVSLHYSTLIVDEASMVNRELLRFIHSAASAIPTCKILYVGDKYQLPPVKENTCPIFEAAEQKFFLTDIQRQAADNPIIMFSHKYREMMDDPELDWPAIPHDGKNIFHYTDGQIWEDEIRRSYKEAHHPDDLRVLAWSNARVIQYNQFIRTQLGHTEHFVEGENMLSNDPIIFGEMVQVPTDGLVRIDAVEKETRHNIEGHMLSISPFNGKRRLHVFQPKDWKAARRLQAQLAKAKDWGSFYGIKNEWADLRPVHAQTVHKSQGSTYQKVFIDVDDIARNNKWYEVARLMYVAITRASLEVHLFGNLPDRYDRTKNPDANNLMEAFANATQVQEKTA